jgi:hypothetical protein
MHSRSTMSLVMVAGLTVTTVRPCIAQIRTPMPTTRMPTMTPGQPQNVASASGAYQIVIWSNARPVAFSAISNVTGPISGGLPSPAQMRAVVAAGKARFPAPPAIGFQIAANAPGVQILARMSVCGPPNCALEIDQLGSCGQVLQSDYFSTASMQIGAAMPGIDRAQFGFQRITSVQNVAGQTTATDDWNTPAS